MPLAATTRAFAIDGDISIWDRPAAWMFSVRVYGLSSQLVLGGSIVFITAAAIFCRPCGLK